MYDVLQWRTASGMWFGEMSRQSQAEPVKQQHTGISPNHVPDAVRYWRGRPGFVLGPVLRPIPGPVEARVRGKLGEFPVSCTPAILESSDSYMHILKLLVADLRYQQIDLNE